MELPNASSEEFVLTRPFVPLAKNNMIALLVARCDAPYYGQLVLYRFPIGTQVLGPTQFTADINQTPDISEKVTLWSQQGSTVQWGNVIVVPMDQGLLYLQPLYLQAANSPIPQLERVITYANGRLTWGSTLDDALSQIFASAAAASGGQAAGGTSVSPPPRAGGTVAGATRAVLVAINAHLQAAQHALAGGDYLTYGREMDAVQKLIKNALAAPTATSASTTTPAARH
jgi:uncharacterized membrane protein (UPF0182 family)